MTHTREEVEMMTPKELRIEIAKLKGWHFEKINSSPNRFWCYNYSVGSISNTEEKVLDLEMKKTGRVFDWPSNITDAWDLIDEIRMSGDEITISSDSYNNIDNFTVIIFRLRNDGHGTGWWKRVSIVNADTVSLAISRVYLMWRETEE